MAMFYLECHPETPTKTIEVVAVNFAPGVGPLWFEFHVTPATSLHLPKPADPERADELWRTTCFELFAKPMGGEAYFEFNFSPSFRWAAYVFDGYRTGMREFPSHDPEIAINPSLMETFFLAVESMPELPNLAMRLGFSAVIEELDGTKSYWALAHPPGKPDFHHPDCFVLDLPALPRA